MRKNCQVIYMSLIAILPLVSCNTRFKEAIRPINDKAERLFEFDLKDYSPGQIDWAPGNDVVAITSYHFQGADSVINVFNFENKELLISNYDVLAGFDEFLSWSPDGRKILVYSNGINGENEGLWILSGENFESSNYLGGGFTADWSVKNEIVLVKRSLNKKGVDIYLYNVDDHDSNLAFTQPGNAFTGISWDPIGERFVFSIDGNSDYPGGELFAFDILSEQVIELTEDGTNSDPEWSPTRDLIAYKKINFEQRPWGYALHIMSSDGKCDIAIDGIENIHDPSWSEDGNRITFIFEGDIYFIDLVDLYGETFLSEDFPCALKG